jgi:hypothetical protein
VLGSCAPQGSLDEHGRCRIRQTASFPKGTTHRYTLFLCQREIRMLVRSSLHALFSHSDARTLWGRWAGQTGLRHQRVVNLALSQQRLLQEVSTATARMRGTTKRLKEHVFGQPEASDHARRRASNWGAEALGEPGQSIRRPSSTMKAHGSSLCKSSPHMRKWRSRQ